MADGSDLHPIDEQEISRGTMTISEFLSLRGLAGGIDLDEDGSSSGVERLQTDQAQKYDLGEELAKGGMGAILDAKDRCIRRRVAMKVMLSGKKLSDAQILRFIEEAQITGQLEHPNIVPVHELGVDSSGNVFYTMKLVHGTTLASVIAKLRAGDRETQERFPLIRLLSIFQRVCEAVAYAHSKGVIHRDLKPANIMLGDFGEVLVMDWGLAKVLPREPEEESAEPAPAADWIIDGIREDDPDAAILTRDGDLMGTPHYMAPEQAQGRTHAVDQRTDIFALGIILYEILTLQRPFTGDSTAAILTQVRENHYPAPRTHSSRQRPIAAPLAAVITKAMATEQTDRYQQVTDLTGDIESYLNGFATQAEQAGPLRQAMLLIQRHKALTASLSAVILALAVGLGIALHQRQEALAAKEEAEHSEKAVRRVSVQAAPSFLNDGMELLGRGKWLEARVALETALALDPELKATSFHLARVHILQEEFSEAAELLSKEVPSDLEPELMPRWRVLQDVATSPPSLKKVEEIDLFADRLRDTENFLLAAHYYELAGKRRKQLPMLISAAEHQLKSVNPGLHFEQSLFTSGYVNDRPRLQLRVSGFEALRDLSPLRRLPIYLMDIRNTSVDDLTPLQGMPLEVLLITNAPVQDLGPLRGARLSALLASGTKIATLEPLSAMPLEKLGVAYTDITDLTPLAGMPLRWLDISSTNLADISVVADLPLRYLAISKTQVDDLDVLSDLPLEELLISHLDVQQLPILRSKSLKSLGAGGCLIDNLAPLEGMPLQVLDIGGCPVTNIDILEGMPIKKLVLYGCPIESYQPLATLPLEELDIHSTTFADLTLVARPQLRVLAIGSTNVTDLSPLADCLELETLILPQHADSLEPLRKLPKLTTIGYTRTTMRPAEEFWRHHDAQQRAQQGE